MASPSSVALLGPVDALLGPYIEWIALVLVLVNFVTRKLAADRYRRQAGAGEDDAALSRYAPHLVSTWLLVLASLYYLTTHLHSGTVLSVLVLGLFGCDFFEFESRRVEAREDLELERPKSSITLSVVVFLYAAFLTVFTYVQPYWAKVI